MLDVAANKKAGYIIDTTASQREGFVFVVEKCDFTLPLLWDHYSSLLYGINALWQHSKGWFTLPFILFNPLKVFNFVESGQTLLHLELQPIL